MLLTNLPSPLPQLIPESELGVWNFQGQKQEAAGAPSWAQSSTSFGRKGLKKQSRSLRRLMTRLLLVEAITSFTEERTNVMESCGSDGVAPVPWLRGAYPHPPARHMGPSLPLER